MRESRGPRESLHVQELREKARTCAVVENRLMRPEDAAYLLAWKEILNQSSADYRLLYGAMGPDISTPFMLTDASAVTGVDRMSLRPDDLFRAFEHAHESMPALSMRYRRSHWNYTDIREMGVERCMAMELKRMGVDLSAIELDTKEIHGVKRMQGMKFAWAFPGEQVRDRQIHFVTSAVEDFANKVGDVNQPPFDAYFEKAKGRPSDPDTIKRIARQVKADGTVIINPVRLVDTPLASGETINDEVNKKRADRRALTEQLDVIFPDSTPVAPPLALLKSLRQQDPFKHIGGEGYGYYLIGRRLNSSNSTERE